MKRFRIIDPFSFLNHRRRHGVRRICFTLQVRPERLEEYRRRHARVWPEMLAALRDAGWHDYSLFLRDDGLLVGYLLTEDFAAAQAAMEATEVNSRWQAEMAPFFSARRSRSSEASDAADFADGRPDHRMRVLTEVFNLDDQLGDVR
jgi:L-rhamnose mutarotase